MRKRFEQQLAIGIVAINEVEFNPKDRHQLSRCLKGLQHIFTDELLSEKVFSILEKKILSDKKSTGRPGMSLWEILVLGCIRLNLNIDYDFLLDQANHHHLLRQILGVARSDFQIGKQYHLQTILDNVGLLDDQTLDEINKLVVESGHAQVKKNWLLNRHQN